jgi:hypothetical protein
MIKKEKTIVKKSIIIFALISLLLSCVFEEPVPAIKVESVSFDWSNTIWENIQFTVRNTGNVALDSVDLYYTAVCAGGNFDDIAEFPGLFDMNSPVEPDAICTVATALATLTGGCSHIVVNQAVVTYDYGTRETIQLNTTFTRP